MTKKTFKFFKSKIFIFTLIIIIIIGVWIFVSKSHKTIYQFVTVQRGTITEVVNVTGNVTSTKSVDLGFQNSGTIADVFYNEGDYVQKGSVIADLNTNQLEAQLAQANANVDSQTATLKNLEAGATPQNIAVSQSAVNAANQTLQNLYSNVSNVISDSYTNANDAVRNQLNAFFINPETNNPQVSFTINDSQIVNNFISERIEASAILNKWQNQNKNISSSTADTTIQNALNYLSTIKKLLLTGLDALVNTTNMSPALETTYKTNITTGLNEINSSITNINTLVQNIASAKIAVAQAEANLNVTLAGSTQEEIDAQKANVKQAQANVQAIEANIQNSSIIAPMSGVITRQDARVGEVVTPGISLVSMIVPNSLEVDSYIPEVDIGKIALNDAVSMTIDAFPNETFTGKIFYINPAETVTSGVVNYQIKVAFDKNDNRLKSGLTVNLAIATKTKNNVLIVPQYAVLQNTSGTFVETLGSNDKIIQNPVTLGISDQNGNVEIISGATENEKIINIGLK